MNEKNLYLVRGLPGAGKTTFSKTIAKEKDMVVAADDFMVDAEGKYAFDASRFDEVHTKCREAVEVAMQKDTTGIFLNNTLTEQWELDPYYTLAKKYGYKVFSVIVENRHEGQNIHGTPAETLEAMKKRFQIHL